MSNYPQVLEKIHKCALNAGRNIEDITLVAVTKNHPIEDIQNLYDQGCRHFGENRVQEALSKMDALPTDIFWHFIGTLQKNKVVKIINQFFLIHSVDSMDLAQKISEASAKQGITSRILIQVNTSGEASKHGLSPENWKRQWTSLWELPALQIEGLMTMAPFTEDQSIIRATFANLRIFKETLEQEFAIDLPHLSMGMSHDYEIAIQEGATLLRIGTALF